jgi:predicted AlkP superfamily phosphohydrolase/phosphomutase
MRRAGDRRRIASRPIGVPRVGARIAALGWAVGAAMIPSCAGDGSPDLRDEAAGRVFLIGIDGVTWDLLDPLLEAERLPNLASLIAEGCRAPLASMVPTKSPALWTTVATGKEFDSHGINDFTQVVRENGPPNARVMHMTSNMRRTKALWNILGDVGLRSAFIGWWVTWPAEQVEGYMVSSHVPLAQTGGKAAPTKGTLVQDLEGQTWPPELFEELRPLIRPDESVTFQEARRFMDLRPEELGKNIVEGFRWAFAADETYRAVTLHLLEKDSDPDLWGIYFNGNDVVGHRYWKYIEPEVYPPFPPEELPRFCNLIDRYYEYTDGLIGEILERRQPGDTFLLISDHGFHAFGHRDGPAGVIIASGRHVEPGAVPRDARLVDVAPTVLALLGIPAAEDMDGRVLDELFTEEWRQRYPRERIETYDSENWREQSPIPSGVDGEILERLRTLGYLE